eukprot:m.90958 g.90958  ORF g.90958 m.90958 type:complete len:425 (+) comp26439_c0_seq2:413-1687(+)
MDVQPVKPPYNHLQGGQTRYRAFVFAILLVVFVIELNPSKFLAVSQQPSFQIQSMNLKGHRTTPKKIHSAINSELSTPALEDSNFTEDGSPFRSTTGIDYPNVTADVLVRLQAMAESCRGRKDYLTFSVGDARRLAYGGSNQVVALTNMIHRAWRWNRVLVWPTPLPPPLLDEHGYRFLPYLKNRFNLSTMMRVFCIVSELPADVNATIDKHTIAEGQRVHYIDANPSFYEHVKLFEKDTYTQFRGMVVNMLYQHPNPVLQQVLEDIRTKLGPTYIGIHLRDMDPTKTKWTARLKHGGDLDLQFEMAPSFVHRLAQARNIPQAKVFLGTDNKRPNLTQTLVTDPITNAFLFNVSDYPQLKDSEDTLMFATTIQRAILDCQTIDFLMFNTATLFIGNDASSVSWNVAVYRRTKDINADNLLGPVI